MTMFTRQLTTLLILALIVGAACGKSDSSGPTSAGPSSTAVPARLAINGPSLVAPGQTTGYTALATFANGEQQDYTQRVSWNAYPSYVLSISTSTGQAVAGVAGEAKINISIPTMSFPALNAVLNVLVLPANTYRLIGRVMDSGLGVADATVTVTAGTGIAQSAKTDYDGSYRLYGVAGTIEISVRKVGYDPVAKTLTLTANDVLDIDVRQTGSIPSLAGSYMLTITPDSNCPSVGNLAPLPAELRRPRSYPAVLAQNGASLVVTVSGDGFAPPSDHFPGRVQPDGVEFTIGDGYFGYGPDDGLSVHLSPTTVLSYEGVVRTPRSTLTGLLDGVLDLYELTTFYRLIGECSMRTHQLTLTPLTTTVRVR